MSVCDRQTGYLHFDVAEKVISNLLTFLTLRHQVKAFNSEAIALQL